MRLSFWKLSGAGNDFVLVEAARLRGLARPTLARRLCSRACIGADGLLVVARRPLGFDYYNSDGSKAFCGNGARCAAFWMRRAGWTGTRARLRSPAGPVEAEALGTGRMRVRMPPARLLGTVSLRCAGRPVRGLLFDTGVPHLVVDTEGLERFPVLERGRLLRTDPALGPAGANVDFVEPNGRGVSLRTYERGIEGETLACGTGAVAAALAAGLAGLPSPVRVDAPGGRLSVSFSGDGPRWDDVRLEGPAQLVFSGEVEL